MELTEISVPDFLLIPKFMMPVVSWMHMMPILVSFSNAFSPKLLTQCFFFVTQSTVFRMWVGLRWEYYRCFDVYCRSDDPNISSLVHDINFSQFHEWCFSQSTRSIRFTQMLVDAPKDLNSVWLVLHYFSIFSKLCSKFCYTCIWFRFQSILQMLLRWKYRLNSSLQSGAFFIQGVFRRSKHRLESIFCRFQNGSPWLLFQLLQSKA